MNASPCLYRLCNAYGPLSLLILLSLNSHAENNDIAVVDNDAHATNHV